MHVPNALASPNLPCLSDLRIGGAIVSGDKLPIRVSDLIAALQKLPQDAFVFTEGCDCYGPCSGVTFPTDQAPHTVILKRDDGRRWPVQEDLSHESKEVFP